MASIILASQKICLKLVIILFLSVAVSGLLIPEFVTLGRSALQNFQRSPRLLPRSPRGPIVKPTVDGDPYAYVPTTTGTAAAAASTSNVIKNPPPASSTATSQPPDASGGLKADSTVKDLGAVWPGSSCDALNGTGSVITPLHCANRIFRHIFLKRTVGPNGSYSTISKYACLLIPGNPKYWWMI